MKLFSSLFNIIKSVFKTKQTKKEPTTDVVIDQVVEPVEVEATPAVTAEIDDPEFSDPTAEITTFLWKPVSDTPPRVAVISVSCDKARAEHVKVQIKDNKGRIIPKLVERYNVGGIKRNNPVPGHVFGRFNFKPGPTNSSFVQYAPLTVSFFLEVEPGKRTRMKVMGKKSIVIKDPTQRLDLK